MKQRPSLGSVRLWIAGLLLAAAAVVFFGAAARAGDHAQAREALERGEILPLIAILQRATGYQPGEIIEVELEREDGRWLYELKLLTPEGLLMEMELDAADGALIDIERDDD